MRLTTYVLTIALVLTLGLASSGFAQESSETKGTTSNFGLRAGLGLDPTQFVIGGQFSIGKRLGIVRIVPSVDLGFGDNITTILFNGDLLFSLTVDETKFRLYGGGGPAIAYLDPESSGSKWEVGLYLVAGAGLPIFKQQKTSFEVRFGITDNVPDFRALVIFEF